MEVPHLKKVARPPGPRVALASAMELNAVEVAAWLQRIMIRETAVARRLPARAGRQLAPPVA